jgi:DNA-binding transcriptional ArsR family regulator
MDYEEDTYTKIFASLKHPIRRKILQILNETPATYTELLKMLGVETGFLNYHLEKLSELISKDEANRYRLSEFGKASLNLVKSVESPVTEIKKDKKIHNLTIGKLLMIITIIVLAFGVGFYYIKNNNLKIQYDEQNRSFSRLQTYIKNLNESRRTIDLALNTTSYDKIDRGIILESNKTDYNRNESLTISLINISGHNIMFGLDFSLEHWVNSQWETVNPLAPGETWAAIELKNIPRTNSGTPWNNSFRQSLALNKFEPGLYRISKVVKIDGISVNDLTEGKLGIVIVKPSFIFFIK